MFRRLSSAGLVLAAAAALAAALQAGRALAQITSFPVGPYSPSSFTANAVLYGNGTSSIQATNASAAGTVLCGIAGAPLFCATPAINQLNGNSTTSLILLSASANPITFQTGSAVSVREQMRIADFGVGTVNYLNVYGRTTGSNPIITVNGTDATIGLGLSSKGTNNIQLFTNGVFTGDILTAATEQVRVVNTTGATNILTLTGSTTNPTIGALNGGVVALSTGLGLTAPNTQTGATYVVALTDNTVIANRAGTITMTLPAVASFTGRRLRFVTITANTVVSNASNVVPLAGGAAGTAILAATAGKWADLECDGTNWIITASN